MWGGGGVGRVGESAARGRSMYSEEDGGEELDMNLICLNFVKASFVQLCV